MTRRTFGPVAGDVLAFVRRSIDSTTEPPFARVLHRQRHLRQRLVEQEGRRHQAGAARRLNATEFAVELRGERLQPREVRLGVRGRLDQVIAVQEARDVEIRADVLDHDVRRVAPAADRDVAVGKREAFERRGVRTAHDLDAGARRRATAAWRRPRSRAPGRPAPARRSAACRPRSDRSAATAARPAHRCRSRVTWHPRGQASAGCPRSRRAASARRRRLAWPSPWMILARCRRRSSTSGEGPPSKPAPQSRHVGSSSDDHSGGSGKCVCRGFAGAPKPSTPEAVATFDRRCAFFDGDRAFSTRLAFEAPGASGRSVQQLEPRVSSTHARRFCASCLQHGTIRAFDGAWLDGSLHSATARPCMRGEAAI